MTATRTPTSSSSIETATPSGAYKGGTHCIRSKGGATRANTTTTRSKDAATQEVGKTCRINQASPTQCTSPQNSELESKISIRGTRSDAILCSRQQTQSFAQHTRRFPIEMINAVINKETWELMEYNNIMKNPKYHKLYCKSYIKELGQISQ